MLVTVKRRARFRLDKFVYCAGLGLILLYLATAVAAVTWFVLRGGGAAGWKYREPAQ